MDMSKENTMYDYLSDFVCHDSFAALIEQDLELRSLYEEALEKAKNYEK